jgi:hypothetical protein
LRVLERILGVHILVSAACDLNFIVNCDNLRLVDKTTKPLLRKSGIPRGVGTSGVGIGRKGSPVREMTVSCISVKGVIALLVCWKRQPVKL